MNRNIMRVLGCFIIVLLLFITGILVGNFNKENKSSDSKLKEQRVSISKIIINSDDKKTSYLESDIVVSNELIDTYKEIINSKKIKSEVEKIYPEVNDIEISVFNDTSILIATYICDSYTDDECIEINKKYVSLFIDVIDDIYNLKGSFVESVFISIRKIEG